MGTFLLSVFGAALVSSILSPEVADLADELSFWSWYNPS